MTAPAETPLASEPAATLAQPVTLPCGATVINRIVKSATSEGLAAGSNHANAYHATLYGLWGRSGAGMIVTGNVMVDRMHLEHGGNIAIDGPQSEAACAALTEMATAARAQGALVVMQLNHAGRQTPAAINPHPKSASPVALAMGGKRFGRPEAMSIEEIEDTIEAFVHAALVARGAGFDGVQIHAAHGYLVSQFLSPLSNRRSDAWGGGLMGRARLLMELVRRVRSACGVRFIVGVKLNSADFQRGGFSEDDSAQVGAWLEGAGADFIELSGGNYEQPRMMDVDRLDPLAAQPKRESTKAREAYFLDFVPRLRKVTQLPVMVTGGFESAAAMQAAVLEEGIDFIGLARPIILDSQTPKALLTGAAMVAARPHLQIGPGIFGPASRISALRDANAGAAMAWYSEQIYTLAAGGEINRDLKPLRALLAYLKTEKNAAQALTRAPVEL
ncbi:NADH:flavin oxidoreductase [Litorivita pollutaquae]|uniref:NADH:flavin oxidoreductase n=1 Tax=Litorivita pollutaquae TaxID=2200892 RepID=A0A2V4N2A7_9RHOB|nr:NADH:flavin oxidoreductase/NADH oxidase family protein [Litorivita pollutaquae]PYC48924.1 NADH:flavin oxidoreductase [Litorivita pollutaquae]